MAAIESSSYNLRNKFKDQLKKVGLSENYFDHSFDIAMKMSKETFKTLLWNMSFEESSDRALESLGLSTSKKEDFYKDLVIPLRNELRFQYTNMGEDFLNPSFAPDFEQVFAKFSKRFGEDKILVNGIWEIALNFVSYTSSEQIERVVFLLKSKEHENFQFGGLKAIGLKDYEVSTLLPKAEVIGTFISEMYQVVLENGYSPVQTEGQDVTKSFASPFSNLDKMLEEKGINLPDESCVESSTPKEQEADSGNTTQTQSVKNPGPALEVKPISPEVFKIIKNADLVDDFLVIYQEIESAGLDIQYLISKRYAVQELLDGFFDLIDSASENF